MAENRAEGTVLRAEDGTLYFIRDDMLKALQMEGEALQRVNELLDSKGEVEGFVMSAGSPSLQVQPIRYVQGSLAAGQPAGAQAPDFGAARASTIMCPWFC